MVLHLISVVDFSERTFDTYSVYAEDEESALIRVVEERGGSIGAYKTLSEILTEFESDDIEVTIVTFDVSDFDDHITTNPAHGKVHELVAN